METASSLLYKPLDPDNSEIRLLEVPPDGSEDWGFTTISLPEKQECDMLERFEKGESLIYTPPDDGVPKYAALSYVWGEKKDLKKIILQGQEVEVTPNLASALSRIRSGNLEGTSTPIKYLWVDAVCINQEDNDERSQQVQIMQRIYKRAEIVYAWVGPKDHSLAFQTIRTLADEAARVLSKDGTIPEWRHISDILILSKITQFELKWLQRYPNLCNQTPNTEGGFKNDAWDSVVNLFRDRYWERVWIHQEVVLAPRLHLFSSGDMTLSRQDLIVVDESFRKLDLRSKSEKGEVQRPEFLCETVWDVLVRFPPNDRIDAIREAMAMMAQRTTLSSAQQPWAIPLRSAGRKEAFAADSLVATDPKDYIYGLLAISGIPMKPNYTKSDTEVYTDFVEGWMKSSREARVNGLVDRLLLIPPLNFLSLAGVGYFGSSDDFPSWAPNFPRNALQEVTKLSFHVPKFWNFRREGRSNHPHLDRDTRSLVVWGAVIEPVLHTSNFAIPASFNSMPDSGKFEAIQKLVLDFGHFFRRYTSRHPHDISGIPSWQTIARLIFKKISSVTRPMVYSLLALAALMSRNVEDNPPDGLGDQDSPDSFIFPSGWETQLYRRTFPDKDHLKRLGLSENPLADKESQMDEVLLHVNVIFKRMVDRSIFETTRGYLGRGPLDVREGDLLCILKDYDQPVLLRKNGDHYAFVGTVFVGNLNQEEWIMGNQGIWEWFKLQ